MPETIDPRDVLVIQATKELYEVIHTWTKRHQLTEAEFTFVVAGMLARQTQKMCLRERGLLQETEA